MKWLIEKCRESESFANKLMYGGIAVMIIIALL
jgi:hypothetical protein